MAMRHIEFINREWLYKAEFKEEYTRTGCTYEDFEKIELPHTNVVLPYNYFDEGMYQFVSCYVKELEVDPSFKGKKLFLDFEGVMMAAKVYCNGEFVCEHKGGYTFFEADITDKVNFESVNTIVVEVDSTERPDIPPHGNVVDYLTYGGIYREVSLRVVEKTYIKGAYVKTDDCLGEKASFEVDVCIEGVRAKEDKVCLTLFDEGKVIGQQTKLIAESINEDKCTIRIEGLKGIELWDITNPKRYELVVMLEVAGEVVDSVTEKIGFRHAKFTPDGFFLNGKALKIVGLNRHQAYPYVGYAMPKRVQEKDADILKYEMGLNLVRTSHYPQSKHFLNRCDEIGLLVFEEIPGWQHIGDKAWQDISVINVKEMITRDFNHPSIILWGVRINESQDNHDFYTRTNEMAHLLDTTRQTGGVRYIQKSEILEDVHTFNDFVHSGGKEILRSREEATGLDYPVPHLVTENNGHMYPTKRFDHESRLVEHAARHLRVVNEALGRDDIVGNISWCAFDYNTHACFGSGDKICYHGVSDMFRLPKYAAHAYAAQKDPAEEVVLEITSVASRGEQDGGGIVPVHIMTNCDYIKVYKNGEFVDDFYPEKELYPHLSHPPIMITYLLPQSADLGISEEDNIGLRKFIVHKVKTGKLIDMSQEDVAYLYNLAEKNGRSINSLIGAIIKGGGGWGDNANKLTIEGYVGEECVITKITGEVKAMERLVVEADNEVLEAGGITYDATRVVVKIIDTLGQLTPFINEAVEVSLEGPAIIMGPNRFALQGGCSAFWIRTTGDVGEIKVKIRSTYFEEEIKLQVE